MTKQAQGSRSWIEKKQNQIGLLVCMLLCFTLLTSALVFVGLYQVRESDHVIALIQEQVHLSDTESAGGSILSTMLYIIGAAASSDTTSASTSGTTSNSAFVVYDDAVTWTTDTSVEIFHLSYDNESGSISVTSENQDAVFAPGTSNSYTFYLKNTGGTSLDYTMWMESSVSNETYAIPIQVRVVSSDGTWILGDEDTWVDSSALNTVFDEERLASGRYDWYTLEWQWAFASGDDEYDTFLGNLAMEEDVSLTVVIHTLAVISEETTNDTENETSNESAKNTAICSTSPKTGDATPMAGYLLFGFGGMLLAFASLKGQQAKRGA